MTGATGNILNPYTGYPNPTEALGSAPGPNPVEAFMEGRTEQLPDSGYLVSVGVDQETQESEIVITRYEGQELSGGGEFSPGLLEATADLTDVTRATLVVIRRTPGKTDAGKLYYGVGAYEAEPRFLPGSGKTVLTRRGLDQAGKSQFQLTQDLSDTTDRPTIHRMVTTHPEVRDVLRTAARAMWLNDGDLELLLTEATQKLAELDLKHQGRLIDRLTERLAEQEQRIAVGGLAKAAARLRRARWSAR